MDCRNAQILLAFALPASGELDAADAAALQKHLDVCADCEAISQAEARFDAVIGRAVNAVEIPSGLQSQLLASLESKRIAWYRRPVSRYVAAAAAILLLVGGGWLWVQTWRTKLDPDKIHRHANKKFEARIETVNAWVKRFGGNHLAAPTDFDYDLLASFGPAEINGHRVPALLFVGNGHKGGRFAQVYILDGSEFDLADFVKNYEKTKQALDSGPQVRLTLLPHPTIANLRYLVLHTNDVENFQKSDRQ